MSTTTTGTEPRQHRTAVLAVVPVSYLMIVLSWGPFAEGRNKLFSDPLLSEIGAARGKYVVLRWLIQRDVVVIPKSVRPERMAENIDVFDFELTGDEMSRIAAMDTGTSAFFDYRDPAMVSQLGNVRNP
jgi:2,5-diketo-D-gluconate reductase A